MERKLKQAEQDGEPPYRAKAEEEIGQNKGFVVLQYLPEDRVHREKQETAADVRHGRVQPEGGDMVQKNPTQNTAQQGSRFHRRNADHRLRAIEARPQQQGAQRQASGTLWTQIARMSEKSSTRPPWAWEVSASWPAASATPSAVQ